MKTITHGLLHITAVCLVAPAYAQATGCDKGIATDSQSALDAETEGSHSLFGGYSSAIPGNKPGVADRGAEFGCAGHQSLSSQESTAKFQSSASLQLGPLRLAEAPARKEEEETGSKRVDNVQASADARRKRRSIEEVVVTATRRAENVQDTPISISVVSAEQIDLRGLVSAEDYLRGMPGVNQSEPALFGQTIQIRGIETSTLNQNAFSGPTVATYIGETPTTTAGGIGGGTNIDGKLVDVERVEVLRGPQGTAFGSGALGGVVRTIPVEPKLDRVEGRVGASYSVTDGEGGDNYNFQAIGNFPLIQGKLALRGSAYQYEQSGFYRNIAGSDTEFRSQVAGFGAEAFAVDENEVGSAQFTGGRIAAVLQASDDLKFTLSYLKQETERDGVVGAMTDDYEQSILQLAPEHSDGGRTGSRFDTDLNIANALVEYNLGWANLMGTYSYVDSHTDNFGTWSSFGLPWPLSSGGLSDHGEDVVEFRLSTKLDGDWNFLVGLYAEELKDNFSLGYIWHGDPATNFFAPGQRELGGRHSRRKLTQKAAFGEASWEFLRGLTLTGGVRAYEYRRTGRDEDTGAVLGNSSVDLAKDASGTNFRANLSYKFNDDALVYGGWSQGFRLGQVQPGIPAGVCDLNGDGLIDGSSISLESTRSLNSDSIDNYEIGGKFALLDRRLTVDAAIFRMDWSEVPVSVNLGSLVSRTCQPFTTHTANAGKARSEGIELQANMQITDSFRVDIGGSWIDATMSNDIPVTSTVAGDRLPGSPEYNANLGLQYTFELAGQYPAARIDATYVGSFYSALGTGPRRVARVEVGDYVQVDASVRIPIRRMDIDLFVRNLTNDDGTVNLFGPLTVHLRPRTIGVQLLYNFGQW